MTGCQMAIVGSRDSDSLLHSLSSGLWAPTLFIGLECPISFSPFLPFGAFGNTAGDGGVFLSESMGGGLFIKYGKDFPMITAHELVNGACMG